MMRWMTQRFMNPVANELMSESKCKSSRALRLKSKCERTDVLKNYFVAKMIS